MTGYSLPVLFAGPALFSWCFVLLHYSTVISKLADQNTILAQRLAILGKPVQAPRNAVTGAAAAADG